MFLNQSQQLLKTFCQQPIRYQYLNDIINLLVQVLSNLGGVGRRDGVESERKERDSGGIEKEKRDSDYIERKEDNDAGGIERKEKGVVENERKRDENIERKVAKDGGMEEKIKKDMTRNWQQICGFHRFARYIVEVGGVSF